MRLVQWPKAYGCIDHTRIYSEDILNGDEASVIQWIDGIDCHPSIGFWNPSFWTYSWVLPAGCQEEDIARNPLAAVLFRPLSDVWNTPFDLLDEAKAMGSDAVTYLWRKVWWRKIWLICGEKAYKTSEVGDWLEGWSNSQGHSKKGYTALYLRMPLGYWNQRGILLKYIGRPKPEILLFFFLKKITGITAPGWSPLRRISHHH